MTNSHANYNAYYTKADSGNTDADIARGHSKGIVSEEDYL
jgi:hypothetical protein